MKNTPLPVWALCLITFTAGAQNVRTEWSDKTKYKTEYLTTVKSPVKDGFVKLSYTPVSERKTELAKSLVLTHYDKRLQFVSEKEIPLDQSDLEPARVICMKNNVYLVSEKHNKSAEASDIDLTSIDLAGDKLGPTRAIFSYPIGSGAFLRIPKCVYSPDSGRALVYVEYIREKGQNLQLADFVMDEKGDKVWDQKFDIPVAGPSPSILGYNRNVFDQVIDNDGNAYLIVSPTGGAAAGGAKYSLISIDSKGSLTRTALKLSDKTLWDAGLTINAAGNIIFGGLYKDREDGNITGYGVYALDKKSFQPLSSKEVNFDPAVLEKLAEDKQAAKGGAQAGIADNFTISSMVTKPNGDVDFIAEFRETIMDIRGMGFFTNMGDLLVLEYKAGGGTACIRVPKFQRSENTNVFASYYACQKNNNLYLLYNDCVENLQSEGKLVSFAFNATHLSNLYLVVTAISDQGRISHKQVMDFEDADLAPRPRHFEVIYPGAVGLFGSKWKYASRADEAIGLMTIN
jgi:hypothetical protein